MNIWETERGIVKVQRKKGEGKSAGVREISHFCQRTESQSRARCALSLVSCKSRGQLSCSARFKVRGDTTPLDAPLLLPFTPPLHLTFQLPPRRYPPQPSHLSEPGTLHFVPGPMPASPPGNVFPALVAVGHIVTLIVFWQWRVRKKQGKKSLKNSSLQGLRRESWRRDRQIKDFPLQTVCCRQSCSVVSTLFCPLCFCSTRSSLSLPHCPPSFFSPHTSRFPVLWRCCD